MKNLILALSLLFSLSAFGNDCVGGNTNTNCSNNTEVRVLIYHRVTNDSPPSQTVISPEMLERHLNKIRELGYTTITIRELTKFMEGRLNLPRKVVALTFDDGWRDNLVAARMLNERDMSATFYVLSGAFDSNLYFSKDDLRNLAKNKRFEIGAHSHTHFMEWEGRMSTADTRTIVGEMLMSRVILEQVIGQPITTFSWPFGYWREETMRFARSVGFLSTVLVDDRTSNRVGGNTLKISRINIDGNCNENHLSAILKTGRAVSCR